MYCRISKVSQNYKVDFTILKVIIKINYVRGGINYRRLNTGL